MAYVVLMNYRYTDEDKEYLKNNLDDYIKNNLSKYVKKIGKEEYDETKKKCIVSYSFDYDSFLKIMTEIDDCYYFKDAINASTLIRPPLCLPYDTKYGSKKDEVVYTLLLERKNRRNAIVVPNPV